MEPPGSKRLRSNEGVHTLSCSNSVLSLKTNGAEILRLATSEAGAVVKVSGLHVVQKNGDAIAIQKEKDKEDAPEAWPITIDFCTLDDSVQWQPFDPIVVMYDDAPAGSSPAYILLLPIVFKVHGIAQEGRCQKVCIPRLPARQRSPVPSATLTVGLKSIGERFVQVTLSRLRPVIHKGELTADLVTGSNAPIGSPVLPPFPAIPPPPQIEASDRLRKLIRDLGTYLCGVASTDKPESRVQSPQNASSNWVTIQFWSWWSAQGPQVKQAIVDIAENDQLCGCFFGPLKKEDIVRAMKDKDVGLTFALRLSRSAGGLVVIMEHERLTFPVVVKSYTEDLLTSNSFGWQLWLNSAQFTAPSLPELLSQLPQRPLPRPETIVVVYGDHNQENAALMAAGDAELEAMLARHVGDPLDFD